MKSRRAKDKGTSKSSAQLDLFARPAQALLVPLPVEPIAIASPYAAAMPAPARSTDALIDYVLGSRRRGRPEVVPASLQDVGNDQKRLLDVRQAAQRLGLSKSTLDKMRCSGRGPRFIRASDRAIRYDPADLQAFADERRRRSTSELAGMSSD